MLSYLLLFFNLFYLLHFISNPILFPNTNYTPSNVHTPWFNRHNRIYECLASTTRYVKDNILSYLIIFPPIFYIKILFTNDI